MCSSWGRNGFFGLQTTHVFQISISPEELRLSFKLKQQWQLCPEPVMGERHKTRAWAHLGTWQSRQSLEESRLAIFLLCTGKKRKERCSAQKRIACHSTSPSDELLPSEEWERRHLISTYCQLILKYLILGSSSPV